MSTGRAPRDWEPAARAPRLPVLATPPPADRTAPPSHDDGATHLRVVPAGKDNPARRRRRFRVLLTLAGVFVVAGVFGIVWLHVMLAQNQFRLDRVNSRVATLQDHYERDRLQVDQLESPQRIVQEAEGKLGMVVPSTVIYLSPSVPPASATSGPPDSSPAEASTPAASSPGTPSATPSAMTAAGRSTPSATLGAAGATASGTPVPSRAPTDWTSVKPLLVPHP